VRGGDHRERRGLVLLVLEDRAGRNLDRLGLEDVLAAREAFQRQREAVDALLDLLEAPIGAASRPSR
jgi:hypothetical protein